MKRITKNMKGKKKKMNELHKKKRKVEENLNRRRWFSPGYAY